jgi:hypothetical protein
MGKGAQRNPGSPADLVKASSFSSSGKAQGLGVHPGSDPTITKRAAEAMKPVPGMAGAPHEGLTSPGVVESYIALTTGEGALGTGKGFNGSGKLPVDVLKK